MVLILYSCHSVFPVPTSIYRVDSKTIDPTLLIFCFTPSVHCAHKYWYASLVQGVGI